MSSSTSLGSLWDSFQDKCEVTWNETWQKIEDSQATLKYNFLVESADPLSYLAIGVTFVASQVLDKLNEDIQAIVDAISPEKVALITNAVMNTFLCLQFSLLVYASKENVENRRRAKELGDENSILIADLEAVNLASNYFYFISGAIATLAQEFVTVATPILLQAAGVLNAVGVFFSFADIASSGVSYKATTDLLSELKRARHIAFLFEHALLNANPRYQQLPEQKKAQLKSSERQRLVAQLTVLSSEDLKKKVREIKKAENPQLVEKLLAKANKEFLNKLKEKMLTNPDMIKTHFQMPVKQEDEGVIEEVRNSAGALISPWRLKHKIFGKMTDKSLKANRHDIVKKMKSQLNVKRRFDVASIFTKILALAPMLMITALALGAMCPPLTPVSSAFAATVGVLMFANLCYKFYRTHQFTQDMVKLTTVPVQP
ncbi:MAG: hypothetical protein ACXWM7_04110 [Parachlamydiaceae bacterium]